MDSLILWLSENIGIFLAVGLLLGLGTTIHGARRVLHTGRRLEKRLRPWLAFAGALVVTSIGLGLVLFFASGLVAMGPALVQQARMLDEPAPDLAYTRLDGDTPGRLADHRGQVVLVNLWATWCPPCREEMPDLERLQQDYRDRGLVVLQLSDEPLETIRGYLDENPMSTVHGRVDPFPWPATGRPSTYVVDRDGVLREAITGMRTYEQFEREITEHL